MTLGSSSRSETSGAIFFLLLSLLYTTRKLLQVDVGDTGCYVPGFRNYILYIQKVKRTKECR